MDEGCVGRLVAYSPALDRIDVAIRAVLLMPRKNLQKEYRRLGIDPEQLQRALLEVEHARTEDQLMQLVAIYPPLLEAALLLLADYWRVTGEAADWHYERRTFR